MPHYRPALGSWRWDSTPSTPPVSFGWAGPKACSGRATWGRWPWAWACWALAHLGRHRTAVAVPLASRCGRSRRPRTAVLSPRNADALGRAWRSGSWACGGSASPGRFGGRPWGLLVALQLLTPWITPAAANVNLAFTVWPGWEQYFPSYGVYITSLDLLALGLFAGLEYALPTVLRGRTRGRGPPRRQKSTPSPPPRR